MRRIVSFAFVVIVLGLTSVKPTASAAIALAIPPKNVLVNDPATAIVPYIAEWEPTLAVFGSHIVVGWIDDRYHGHDHGGINFGVGYGFSTDGGSTFTDAGALGASLYGADPSLAVDRAGTFYFGRMDSSPAGSLYTNRPTEG
jgi:hypothetical protein